MLDCGIIAFLIKFPIYETYLSSNYFSFIMCIWFCRAFELGGAYRYRIKEQSRDRKSMVECQAGASGFRHSEKRLLSDTEWPSFCNTWARSEISHWAEYHLYLF